jgi:hypothetical protein
VRVDHLRNPFRRRRSAPTSGTRSSRRLDGHLLTRPRYSISTHHLDTRCRHTMSTPGLDTRPPHTAPTQDPGARPRGKAERSEHGAWNSTPHATRSDGGAPRRHRAPGQVDGLTVTYSHDLDTRPRHTTSTHDVDTRPRPSTSTHGPHPRPGCPTSRRSRAVGTRRVGVNSQLQPR